MLVAHHLIDSTPDQLHPNPNQQPTTNNRIQPTQNQDLPGRPRPLRVDLQGQAEGGAGARAEPGGGDGAAVAADGAGGAGAKVVRV
jgi:hypothetical protein